MFGIYHRMRFRCAHATKKAGGYVDVDSFRYSKN